MKLIDKNISIKELKEMSEKMFKNMVKAVVDVEKEIMVVDAPLHADEEYFLLENNSKQGNLWGITIFPDKFDKEGFVVFDSMINLRPGQGNRTRSVDNPDLQKRIKEIVRKLVTK